MLTTLIRTFWKTHHFGINETTLLPRFQTRVNSVINYINPISVKVYLHGNCLFPFLSGVKMQQQLS
jgi:hypothetical protein